LICGKKSNTNNHLKIHQKTHDKNRSKPFKCQRCDYTTDNNSNFKVHKTTHERQDKKIAAMKNPLKCEKCPKFFRNKQALSSHMKIVHPEVMHIKRGICQKNNFLKF